MLPYFEQPAWHLGPLTIHAFGVTVAAAMWFALTVVPRRLLAANLDPVVGQHLGRWMLTGGLLGAHLLSVLLYFPEKLRHDPLLLLRVWEDISSFGGMLGGVTGAFFFFWSRQQQIDRRTALSYLDAVAFVFPAALAIGRLGCALAHDHPGVVTTFPLAISLETDAAREYLRGIYESAGVAFPAGASALGFHDLGLYECLFLTLVIVPAFLYWDRRRRPAGFYLAAFSAIYFPVRFGLDMLRVSDARYLRLTPAQWVAALVAAAVPFALFERRKIRFAISGAVILGTAWACWGGPR